MEAVHAVGLWYVSGGIVLLRDDVGRQDVLDKSLSAASSIV
ncbi:formate dehydrogenase accessory sulfurtransferase FdhD [Allopontixanthobacter confluentis]|nr:formate dehydrogenase accessory sulfurtransferase FdhD [Allopontixanthobacter confluentis]